MDRRSKGSEEQPFSDSTVQCDEWEVKRLTQQMSGYYDDVPTVDVQLDQRPMNSSPTSIEPSNAPIPVSNVQRTAVASPPEGAPSTSPVRGARGPLLWIYMLALLAAAGAYLLAWGAY